jgi:cellulose synthase/poly-beta-1,6-N-acetylglucosamine synthase-like glycosyltransferase
MLPWICFLLCLGTILYVVLAYPVLLSLVVKRCAKPICKREQLRTVSVLIPVHNGEAFIREKIESLLAQNYPKQLVEIIVLSDGSIDDTNDIVREFAAHGVNLIELRRGGKPACLNVGISSATGEILVLTDVRQTLDPDCVRKLVACFGDDTVGVVSGELLIRKGDSHAEADIGLYWRFESWIRKQLASLDSMFGATGPIYAIRRTLATTLPNDILLDDMYLPLAAFFKGYRLVVEEQARAFDHPAKLTSEFRRKVRTLAGNYQILTHLPQLLGPQNRMWLHFASYKLGRLVLPFALAGTAISSLFLPGIIGTALICGQLGFYTLAAVDGFLPKSTIKRISSPARTFVVMMIAAICALSVLFVPPQMLWTQSTIKPLKARSENPAVL